MGEQYTLPTYYGEEPSTEYQVVIGELEEGFTSTALSNILVYAVGACVGLCLFWWAVRKVSSMFMRAFKKGKLRI